MVRTKGDKKLSLGDVVDSLIADKSLKAKYVYDVDVIREKCGEEITDDDLQDDTYVCVENNSLVWRGEGNNGQPFNFYFGDEEPWGFLDLWELF